MATRTRKKRTDNEEVVARVRQKLKAQVSRTNPTTDSAGFIPYTDLKGSKEIRGKAVFTRRTREVNEAMPPEQDLFSRPNYRYGDGDIHQHRRTGSDHSHLKSFGNQT